jgi:5-methylcytosine-specific restriction endonuclease McrA
LRNRESIRAKWQAEYKSDPAKFQVSKRRRRAREHDVVTESYTWKDVVKKWGNKCHICGDEIDLEANRRPGLSGWENGLHLDHVIPIRLLGADTLENVKPAHGICNLRKH